MFAADDGGCMCTSRAVLNDHWPPAVCDQSPSNEREVCFLVSCNCSFACIEVKDEETSVAILSIRII